MQHTKASFYIFILDSTSATFSTTSSAAEVVSMVVVVILGALEINTNRSLKRKTNLKRHRMKVLNNKTKQYFLCQRKW